VYPLLLAPEATCWLPTDSITCQPAAAMGHGAVTGRPEKPACEHTGTALEHGSCPTTDTAL